MNKSIIKRNLVLGILFFLPVTFLLFLYPSKHNYKPLDILSKNVQELTKFQSNTSEKIALKNSITILAFFGRNPENKGISALNLKELIHDKFRGFKGFQTVVVLPNSAQKNVEELNQQLGKFEELKYWKYVFGTPEEILVLHESLQSKVKLDTNLATDEVFIIDKEQNLRGRLDDRLESEKEKNSPIKKLTSYNCIDIDIIKNKMSDDLRILFTEYREKRKGNFDSSTRRDNDLKPQNEH